MNVILLSVLSAIAFAFVSLPAMAWDLSTPLLQQIQQQAPSIQQEYQQAKLDAQQQIIDMVQQQQQNLAMARSQMGSMGGAQRMMIAPQMQSLHVRP
jgi:uncharacterized membrane protein (DUF106 family)